MIQELKQYKTADLVLQVNKNYDPLKLNLMEWDRYLDILCGDRNYQKEAIQTAIVYMASGIYAKIEDLVEENYRNPKNVELRNRFQTVEDYIHHLQLPHKLACTIDLATGTGKSYVIYGIAQIMLGLGLVDRVLVLCPSLTIEDGLLEKFRTLTADAALLKAIPERSRIKNPSVKTADVTIKEGDLCIENIHAVYDRTGSSIKDSFGGNGKSTLVLNDECHHIFNSIEGRDKESQNLKKWKEFLVSKDYDFHYIVGFSGTTYIKDEYFNDVIYRYSLRQAVNDKMVKTVDYVSKNDDAEIEIKFQEIWDNHNSNKNNYRRVKPLTILVTKDITSAKQLKVELLEFLAKQEGMELEDVENKVLIVTSASEHKANLKKLKEVDKKNNSTEWIVSVSMLTEGWDVKNVFQIVPWEDRAFNSKLLISQVLGRGLRVPPEYQTPQPKVRIFNHDAWSRNIKGLVDEILEIEMRLFSNPIDNGVRSNYHFTVHQMDYKKEPIEKEAKNNTYEYDYTKGYILLQSQTEDAEKETEYTDLYGSIQSKNTLIRYNTWTIDDIVNKIYNELKLREWEGKILKLPTGNYSKENLPPRDEVKSIIRRSMDDAGIKGDRLIEANKIKIESSFNTLLRKAGKTTIYEKTANIPFEIRTQSIERESLAVGNLRHNSTVYYSSDFSDELDSENRDILYAIIDDESFPKSANKTVNSHLFKTPLDIIFTKSSPERKFVDHLCKSENAKIIDSWLKSRDVNFYTIEYSITSVGGKHSKVQNFNPDFIIKIINGDITHFIFVETKEDDDISSENKAKMKYAKLHFANLNNELEKLGIKEYYHFHFLSPGSYGVFFDYLRSGQLINGKFRSELETKLADVED